MRCKILGVKLQKVGRKGRLPWKRRRGDALIILEKEGGGTAWVKKTAVHQWNGNDPTGLGCKTQENSGGLLGEVRVGPQNRERNLDRSGGNVKLLHGKARDHV